MCVCVWVLSCVWLFVAPWIVVCRAPLPTRHGIFKDHLKLCLTTTNKNAKKQTELLSCVETFCNNGEVCVSVCLCVCVGGGELKYNLPNSRKDTVYTEWVGLKSFIPTQRDTVQYPAWRAGTGTEESNGQREWTSSVSENTYRFYQTTLQELQGSQTGNC